MVRGEMMSENKYILCEELFILLLLCHVCGAIIALAGIITLLISQRGM